MLPFSHKVSSAAHKGSAIYNVSELLTDVTTGSRPRNVSVLYASDRQLFTVTSSTGTVRLNRDVRDLPRGSRVYSLALRADYPPDLSLVFIVCLRMAAENKTSPTLLPPASDYREITIQVSENIPVGSVLIPNVGYVFGIRNGCRYEIVSGNDARLFEIDRVTGNVSTRAEVDYELRRFHRFVVRITVAETAEVSVVAETAVFAVVIVSVDDVNEYRPVFPVPVYRRAVFGSQKIGSFVATVRALDRDSGRFGQLRYRSLLPTAIFVVDKTSGHVWLGKTFAMTSRSGSDDVIRLDTTVVAEDAGGWTDQVHVQLTILPGSQAAGSLPAFTRTVFEFQVEASVTSGHVIGSVSLSGNESAQFSLRRSSQYFAVERHTGRIVVIRDLSILATIGNSQVPIHYSLHRGAKNTSFLFCLLPASCQKC